MQRKALLVLAFLAAPSLLTPTSAASAVDFGVRAGEYTDVGEPFVGVELLMPITRSWYFNPNVEYVFVDRGDLLTINGDLHYDFAVDRPMYLWAGGGPALVLRDRDRPGRRNDDDDNETEFGLNLLAGIGLKTAAGIVPYAQLKAILSDENEFVVAFGVRF